MTNEQFRQIFVPKLTDKYLKTPDKVSLTAAWSALSVSQRNNVQLALERGREKKAGEIIQSGRQQVALALATARINEIIADGNLSIDLELDELI